jgi:hypothetical protein
MLLASRPATIINVLTACLLATPAISRDTERSVPVTLAANGQPQVLEDAINEYETVSYIVQLQKGQQLQATLASNNAANCFDIYAPGETKPFYVGADSGNSHSLAAPTTGSYRIRVFLLRFAARDGQSARYELELSLKP